MVTENAETFRYYMVSIKSADAAAAAAADAIGTPGEISTQKADEGGRAKNFMRQKISRVKYTHESNRGIRL